MEPPGTMMHEGTTAQAGTSTGLQGENRGEDWKESKEHPLPEQHLAGTPMW